MTTQHRQSERPFQFRLLALFILITVACVVLAYPAILYLVPSLLLLLIGGGCIYGCLARRPHGWISGLLFGIVVMIMAGVSFIQALRPILN